MDGREGMALQGSASYYLHRAGIGGSGGSGPGHTIHGGGGGGGGGGSAAGQPGGIHSSPALKNLSNTSIQVQPNVGVSAGAASSSSFHVENPSQNFSHGRSMAAALPGREPVKNKRGRPRKYAPDGANMSAPKPSSSLVINPGEKVRRGRPPGTGWKQKLAPLGDNHLWRCKDLLVMEGMSAKTMRNTQNFALNEISVKGMATILHCEYALSKSMSHNVAKPQMVNRIKFVLHL
ncbi:hypothetical protein C2S53_013981 [Perilla frutescens var. hirtella]|uniref:AT-hook motif nuclear-localized protein n=1 Tax=Perilla frutescens var. hirtella TaxID=608512 RepID=A0AAD4PFZ8_PERFH|nr:hypothetical protein C2S51_006733 [Perilla frutescens var. frutescens]KAH6837821.1 hypothetical protein C2S53_013981 [Perilla frutescens var. hirtella]